MTIEDDCPEKSNIDPADLALLDEIMASFPDDEPQLEARLAVDLPPAEIERIRRSVSPALTAVELEQERRRNEIAAKSAKQARDDYAMEKRARTGGEDPRPYNPTGIDPRHLREGDFETEAEYKRRYDRELKRLKRPKFVPLTDEQKKERKRASNAKRKSR